MLMNLTKFVLISIEIPEISDYKSVVMQSRAIYIRETMEFKRTLKSGKLGNSISTAYEPCILFLFYPSMLLGRGAYNGIRQQSFTGQILCREVVRGKSLLLSLGLKIDSKIKNLENSVPKFAYLNWNELTKLKKIFLQLIFMHLIITRLGSSKIHRTPPSYILLILKQFSFL